MFGDGEGYYDLFCTIAIVRRGDGFGETYVVGTCTELDITNYSCEHFLEMLYGVAQVTVARCTFTVGGDILRARGRSIRRATYIYVPSVYVDMIGGMGNYQVQLYGFVSIVNYNCEVGYGAPLVICNPYFASFRFCVFCFINTFNTVDVKEHKQSANAGNNWRAGNGGGYSGFFRFCGLLCDSTIRNFFLFL